MQENGEKIDIFSLENGASAYSLEFRGEGNLAMGSAKCTQKRHERFGNPAEQDSQEEGERQYQMYQSDRKETREDSREH